MRDVLPNYGKTSHFIPSAITFLKLKAMTDIDTVIETQNDKEKETKDETELRCGQGQKVLMPTAN